MMYILLTAIFIMWLIIVVSSFHYQRTKKESEVYRLKLEVAKQNENVLQEKLLGKVKEKIELTQRSQKLRKQKDELIASYIYKQEHVFELGEEIKSIYSLEYSALQSHYPQLTELDMLVICLLGIGMSNEEICDLIKMERRTLYRRRQLIGQRIGISSTELDVFAQAVIEPN